MKTVWEVFWGVTLGMAAVVVLKSCTAVADSTPGEAVTLEGVQITVVSLDSFPAYDTLEEAAVHAAERLYKCSQYYECASIIVKRTSDGKFINGPTRSDYAGDHVQIDTSHPPGGSMVASVHSHPCNPDSHYNSFFSPDDLIGDIAHKDTGFMVDLCTGDVHEFDPARDVAAAEELSDDPGTYSTHGRIVGHIEVSKASVEPNTGF